MTEFEIRNVVSLLLESVERIRALRFRNGYAPEGGHQLWNDLLELRGSPDPFQSYALLAYSIAAAQLGAADDHLIALETLLLDVGSTVAPYVLARAAIEAAGRASMLLDPALSARERAGLAVREAIHDLEQLQRLMKAHDPDRTSPEVRRDIETVGQGLKALQRDAEARGLVVPRARPSFTRVVRSVLSTGADDDVLGRVTAVSYSSISHAGADILMALTADAADPDGHPFKVGFVDLTDEAITDIVIAVLVAHVPAVSRQVSAYGWPSSSWTRWRGHVRAELRSALSAQGR